MRKIKFINFYQPSALCLRMSKLKNTFYLYARCNWFLLPKWCYSFLSAGRTDTSRHIGTPERRTDRTNPEDTLIKKETRETNSSNKIFCLFYHEWGHIYRNNREIKAKCLNMKAKHRILKIFPTVRVLASSLQDFISTSSILFSCTEHSLAAPYIQHPAGVIFSSLHFICQ